MCFYQLLDKDSLITTVAMFLLCSQEMTTSDYVSTIYWCLYWGHPCIFEVGRRTLNVGSIFQWEPDERTQKNKTLIFCLFAFTLVGKNIYPVAATVLILQMLEVAS